ncbi:MAG: enoyl-CoA hydratase/isomerase family protein, partial [Egibacteraceae bacterium]
MSVAVSIHRKGRLAWVILDRPARRNVLDRQTLEHLAVGARELAADATVAAILLRGEGGHFSAGADIDALAAFASPDEARVYAAAGQDACAALEHAPVPVIAAIRGSCVGGGLELALSCDFRFAAPDATFGQVELGIGSVAAWGGIRRLPRVVGVAAAKQLVYTAD